MKRIICLALAATLLTAFQAMAWNNRGHSTVACIADRHLTDRARKNIEGFIGPHSIAYIASWMDYKRKVDPYKATHYWHTDYPTVESMKDANGNAVEPCNLAQVKNYWAELADFRSQSDSMNLISLRYLVHLLGDMHCPSHVRYYVNRHMKVMSDGKKVGFHAVWDALVLEVKYPGVSPEQLAEILDSSITPEEAAKRAEGTADDWFNQTAKAAQWGEDKIPSDKVLTCESFYNEAAEVAKRQILDAGLRLARVLNDIYDK